MKRTIEIFRDAGAEWRWRRKAGNGEIVADSAEGYTERHSAVEAALREFPEDELVLIRE